MLHHSEKNHVSFANEFSAPGLSHQINALCSATREDDFIGACRADVLRDAFSRSFVSFGRTPAQCVQSAVNICVVALVKISNRFDDWTLLLRSRRAIKIDQ